MLDIKLKNIETENETDRNETDRNDNRKNRVRRNGPLWIGLILAGLAAAAFTALMPVFEKRANQYYGEAGSEGIESETFVSALIQSNFVFYKNVMDKNGGKNHTWTELYLEEELEKASGQNRFFDGEENGEDLENYYYGNERIVDAQQIQSILGLYASQMQETAEEIESSPVQDIKKNMDYYVLDKTSGMSMKNTTLPIEDLLKSSDGVSGEEAVKDYVYYVIMDYDGAGNLQHISTRGRDADRLLKTVQTIESGNYGRLLMGRDAVETFVLVDSDTQIVENVLTVSQKKPANATFVYALTKEQMQTFLNRGSSSAYLGRNFGMASLYSSYFRSGAVNVYLMFMAVIFAVVILIALCKPVLLEGKRDRRMPLEVTVAAACFFLGPAIEIAVWHIERAGAGTLFDWLVDGAFLQLSSFEYEVLSTVSSFCFFLFLYGVVYFLCLEVSDIFRGVKKYFGNRCLCIILWRKISGLVRKYYVRLKEEIIEVDLGKDADKLLRKLVFINFCLLTTACLFWAFGIFGIFVYSIVLYFVLRKYIHTIQEHYARLLTATNSIAQGKLNNTFEEDFGVFESYREELYKIQDGFKNAVDEEVKSQKMKTELITNVSHDLKTPLTAIITYIDLLKEKDITQAQREEYLATLERKALRLKVLIEDLFEVSKATSGTVKLDPVSVDICHLMRQVYLEYEDKMQEAGLQVRFAMPEEKVVLYLDSQKTYRIFENLYTNIIKYAMPDTRVFITARQGAEKTGIHIELKNISAQEITGNPQDLSERFVRGDAARNTEGSGLGLAIAKSFTELQGGKFRIKTDADLFKVVIDW